MKTTKLVLSLLFVAAIAIVAFKTILPEKQKKQIVQFAEFSRVEAADLAVAIGFSTCDIKGNRSYGSGEKIYHVRGQENYFETRINPLQGERWFCTEADARAAGWRRARR